MSLGGYNVRCYIVVTFLSQVLKASTFKLVGRQITAIRTIRDMEIERLLTDIRLFAAHFLDSPADTEEIDLQFSLEDLETIGKGSGATSNYLICLTAANVTVMTRAHTRNTVETTMMEVPAAENDGK
ncbi:hypothetical protein Tco_0513477 [Tanacetum coccineum]